MTPIEALFIAHIILNIAILVLIVIIKTKLNITIDYLYRILNRVHFATHTLEQVERKIEELNEKVVG